ncbi:MAG: hypothetical protein AAGF99_02595 [Bacteroidota bacterium]
MDRSTDGGRTWQRGVYDSNQISCFLQTTLPVFEGAVVGCRHIAAFLRSDDDGDAAGDRSAYPSTTAS